jgi:hypothetical protein
MQDSTVLDIGSGTNMDAVNIAARDDLWPQRYIIRQGYPANDQRRLIHIG